MTGLFQLGEHAIWVSSNGFIDVGLLELRLIKKMSKSSWWFLLSTHEPTLSSNLLVFIVWENKFIIYGFQVHNVIFPNIQPCMHKVMIVLIFKLFRFVFVSKKLKTCVSIFIIFYQSHLFWFELSHFVFSLLWEFQVYNNNPNHLLGSLSKCELKVFDLAFWHLIKFYISIKRSKFLSLNFVFLKG